MIEVYNPLIVRENLRRLVDMKWSVTLSQGARGRILGDINSNYKSLGMDQATADYFRRMLFCFLFAPESERPEPLSSKQLNDFQWSALYRWMVGADGAGRKDAQRYEQWLCHSATSVMATRATVYDALIILRGWKLPERVQLTPGDSLADRICRLGAAALSGVVMESFNEIV